MIGVGLLIKTLEKNNQELFDISTYADDDITYYCSTEHKTTLYTFLLITFALSLVFSKSSPAYSLHPDARITFSFQTMQITTDLYPIHDVSGDVGKTVTFTETTVCSRTLYLMK